MRLLSLYRLKANSIIESVIAMTIIAICLSLAMIIYSNVIRTGKDLTDFIAHQKVKELLWEALSEKSFKNETYTFKYYEVVKEVEKKEESDSYKLTFTVKRKSNKHIYEFIVRK